MKVIKLLFVLIFTISNYTTYAQNCSEYHLNKCRWADESFLYSRQSRSALFSPGMTSEFAITAYGGEEYYVSIQGNRKLGKIRIRVKEDDKNKTVLYNSAHYEYEDFFFFKNENTRNLIIEVSSEAAPKFADSDKRYCIGVLIQFRNYKKEEVDTGF